MGRYSKKVKNNPNISYGDIIKDINVFEAYKYEVDISWLLIHCRMYV